MGGKPRPALATMITSSRRPRPLPKLPPLLRLVVAFLVPYTHAGWTFAVLAPRRARKRTALAPEEQRRSHQEARAPFFLIELAALA